MNFNPKDPATKTEELVSFCAQLYDVKFRKDGSARVTFEVGGDALDAINTLQKYNCFHNQEVSLMIVPFANKQLP